MAEAVVRRSAVALDLGTVTGWALIEAGEVIASGAESFKPAGRFEGGGMRFVRFRRWCADVLQDVGEVYFEEVRRHAGTDAAHVYGGLLAHLAELCESKGIPYAGVPVGTIKKHATGKGNASKTEMIVAMQRAGFSPGCDNEADALALARYVVSRDALA